MELLAELPEVLNGDLTGDLAVVEQTPGEAARSAWLRSKFAAGQTSFAIFALETAAEPSWFVAVVLVVFSTWKYCSALSAFIAAPDADAAPSHLGGTTFMLIVAAALGIVLAVAR